MVIDRARMVNRAKLIHVAAIDGMTVAIEHGSDFSLVEQLAQKGSHGVEIEVTIRRRADTRR
jgi:hypothetical protein